MDQSLIQDPEEQKWLLQVSEILNHQLDINDESPRVSLVQVPEAITTKKPEAYEPQQIGLGPIHHFQPHPFKKMEQKKLDVVRKLQQNYEIKDLKLTVLDKVEKLIPSVRSCYDMLLQGNDEFLAWVFAIDGLFLLSLLDSEDETEVMLNSENKIEEIMVSPAENNDQQPRHRVGPRKRLMAQDIMMLENQIPFMVLKEINEALHPSSSSSSSTRLVAQDIMVEKKENPMEIDDASSSANEVSTSIYRAFCEIHSPLELCSNSQAPRSVEHLLHYMYSSVVNNVPVEKYPPIIVPVYQSTEVFMQANDFLKKVPVEEIREAYENTISILETFSQTNKVLIPSASTLHKGAGFGFHALEDVQGIRKIRVCGKDVWLPCVTLNTDSEVILRNLVAFETLMATESEDFLFTEYMRFMCGLIVNEEDAKLLRSKKIFKGGLGDSEVVKLLAGMKECIPLTMKSKQKSKLQEVIDEINKDYEGGVRMKAYLVLQKIAQWVVVGLKAIGGFVQGSWKIITFVLSIVMVFVLTWQAYCDVYGCDNTTLTLMPSASTSS